MALSRGAGRAIPLVPIPSVAEVLEWEQTRARKYFETIDDPVLGKIRVPGRRCGWSRIAGAVASGAATGRAQSRNFWSAAGLGGARSWA